MNIKSYETKNILVSGLTINNRLHSYFINALNNAMELDCVKHGYNFIENSNILPDYFWQDGFPLNN